MTDKPQQVRRRKGRRITVEEARQIALRAMAITDALLAEDREREAASVNGALQSDLCGGLGHSAIRGLGRGAG